MKNEDELMIALDLIKTYSDAAQLSGQHLNDAIKKIENVRSDIIRSAQNQAKETVKSELSEPLSEFNKQSNIFWNDSKKIIQTLNDQIENNKWKHTFIFSISAVVFFASMILALFMWIPSIDEIKQRRGSIDYLTPKVEELRAKYNAEFSNCGGKACVRVEPSKCYANKGTNIYDLCILK